MGSAIEEFEKTRDSDCYYFLDYLAVNQHKPIDDLGGLTTVIGKCETFLLVMSPWDKPIPTTRAWCIFEIANAIRQKRKFSITMGPAQQKSFNEGLLVNPTQIIRTLSNLKSRE